MASFNYKNINDILSSTEPIRGYRKDTTPERKWIIPRFETLDSDIITSGESVQSVELHIFHPTTGYLTSIYDIETWNLENTVEGPFGEIVLDIHKDIENLNLPAANYRIVYNFFRNFIGGAYDQKMFISQISADRTELKISLSNPENETALEQLRYFVLEYLKPKKYLTPVVLNFGENKIIDVINISSDGNRTSFFVKLYEPLPDDIDIYFECWVATEIMKPYIDLLSVELKEIPQDTLEISGPNFEAWQDYWISTETDYKSWNDLLSTNVQTSQEILNRYIFDSGSSVKLNIDFRDFKNFIFYSSAEDRVENFVYKINLIHGYNTQLNLLSTYTGSFTGSLENGIWTTPELSKTGSYSGSFLTNKINIQSLKDKLIAGFDEFEKWMYYETTASNYYTYQEDSPLTPYPKYSTSGSDYTIATKEGKYKFYTPDTNEVITWYEDILDKAIEYDLKNYNGLHKSIPIYIYEDSENSSFVTFVNMIGQHFDIMYWYTDHIIKKNKRVENPKDGLSQDLVYNVTKNLGWTLAHGTQAKDLWEYALGVGNSTDPIWTGKTTTNKYNARTEEERTKEVWRRILNNLPYIYKTKGTARGVKALLAAYGIPQTILSIREYGGPDNADFGMIPKADWEKHTYYMNFKGSYPLPTRQHHVRVPWERVNNDENTWTYPDTVALRWKMEPDKKYHYTNDSRQTLLQKTSGSNLAWYVTVEKDGTDIEKGSLNFYLKDNNSSTYLSASIEDEYLYDDVPLNLMLRRSFRDDADTAYQSYDLILKTGKYGKIVVERSASIIVSGTLAGNYNKSWSSDGNLFIGSGSNPLTDKILSGSIYELRYWSRPLSTGSFNNHTLAPRSYNGNTTTSSYYDLQGQWKFWQKFDAAATQSLVSSHPNQKQNTFYSSSKNATLFGFDSSSFESIVETYTMEVPSVAGDTPYAEKTRIDSGSLNGELDVDDSYEVSMFDKFSVDSNKLMIAFSPQHVINEDIYESIGHVQIDDFFGEYGNMYAEEYPRLKWFAREYWKKYPNKNDFTAYINLISIFDFSVFEQIKQTLPARVNPILGLVIEPNILERSKVVGLRAFSATDDMVKETNDISKLPEPYMNISSNKTTIMIGFDEEPIDVGNLMISKDVDFSFTFDSDYQEVDDDINVKVNTEMIDSHKVTHLIIEKPRPTAEYKQYDISFSGLNGTMTVFTNYLNTNLTVFKTKLAGSIDIVYDGLIVMPFGSVYNRLNVQKQKDLQEDVGYGYGWYGFSNEETKTIAYVTPIETHRSDGYYKKFNFYYQTVDELIDKEYTSYKLTDAEIMNSNNVTTGMRNRNFDGCKISSPAINEVDYSLNSGPWQPVVEVTRI